MTWKDAFKDSFFFMLAYATAVAAILGSVWLGIHGWWPAIPLVLWTGLACVGKCVAAT